MRSIKKIKVYEEKSNKAPSKVPVEKFKNIILYEVPINNNNNIGAQKYSEKISKGDLANVKLLAIKKSAIDRMSNNSPIPITPNLS
jgi:hypothetical protein|tara:strand:- start:144 stop:401 length:258 start_codon:yes stop_codon:yes gene_type:complete